MLGDPWPVGGSALALVGAGVVLVVVGTRFTRLVDRLADRTGMGEALAGALLVGATTSLPGLVTTVLGAADGQAGFAVSNAVGGIAAQTTFLAVADLTYRRVNLEHAAASLPNLLQTMVLVGLIGLVLAAPGTPDDTLLGIHPVTIVLVAGYAAGVRLVRQVREQPLWAPARTAETRADVPDPDNVEAPLGRLWLGFAAMAVTVGATGWVIAQAGLSIAARTGLSGSLVGGAVTSVVSSAPELVTVLAAVRIGALTLAVGDIIGGNTFDVLFVAGADLAFREGSIYHAAGPSAQFLLALTVVLTSVLAAGLIRRDRRGIGFEGVAILVVYAAGVASLVALG